MNRERVLAASAGLTTPVAVVDVEVMEANLQRMQERARAAGLRLRPHAKTHKSPWVAGRQLALGAAGLTVATLVEAEALAAAGVDDLLLAHPPVGRPKLERLRALAERLPRLAVGLDDVALAAALPPRVEVMWEVDSGLRRLGTAPGRATAEPVLRLADAIGAERVRGLMTHGGHAYRAAGEEGRRRAAEDERCALLESAAELAAAGLRMRELSVGSTPTARFAGGGVTEMRPGTYVYGDANQVALGSQEPADCALAVVATVVSTPERGRAVVDAGAKALSADLRAPGLDGWGLVLDRPALRLERLSEEHGMLLAADGQPGTGLGVGDRVLLLPAHACTTINLHPEVLMVGANDARWDPVTARGWR